jgi:flagellar motor protein MotB
MPRLTNRRALEEDDEGFYVSMSDMLTGLLFIFIILLVYYAVYFQQKEEELTGAKEARSELLEDLRERMDKRGIAVEIVEATGVLRLTESRAPTSTKILFTDASKDLTPYGQQAVNALADELAQVLPCYTDEADPRMTCPKKKPFRVDVLLVEGHSDKRRYFAGGKDDLNLDLSTNRAITTYNALRARQPGLDQLKTKVGSGDATQMMPILSVSGYGSSRPAFGHDGDDPKDFDVNRRIDLRFLMATPDVPADNKGRRP